MERSCALGPAEFLLIPETVTKNYGHKFHIQICLDLCGSSIREYPGLTHPLMQIETIACLCRFSWVSLNQSQLKQSTQSDRFQASVPFLVTLHPKFVNYMSFSISPKKQI